MRAFLLTGLLVTLACCGPDSSGNSQTITPTDQPSPYISQLYEMARIAEVEQLAKSPQAHLDQMASFKVDSNSYSFESNRWGDFLSVFIARGKQKYAGSLNLASVHEITLIPGHPPDMEGSVIYNVSQVADDPKNNGFSYMCGSGNYNSDCSVNYNKPPMKGYHYEIVASLPPARKSDPPIIYIPQPVVYATSTASSGSTYSCGGSGWVSSNGGGGGVYYTSTSIPPSNIPPKGNYGGVTTPNVARDAEDDVIEFSGLGDRIYVPAGHGAEVRDSILAEIAKGYHTPEGVLK